ncbi:MAG: LLM class flavin-dependent oxidoreductase [Spiribacter salinus]|uniref:LLM class flavin-dependent oxidoreductase n=1 Tax=Spiribacter salinus TaxID=1335746 RepID=A0A540VPF6_9GAMM|nr:MAG: LLM class flavin-dependent oxidoreductase [Spiribacter salinus]
MTLTRLSVLEQSPVPEGVSAGQVLQRTGELARIAEELGYTRFWLSEHHNTPYLASAAPEILTAHVAAVTRRIRVGAGAVLLPNYSPLKVAEVFRLLHALHPERIDLGIGHATGADPPTAQALQRGTPRLSAQASERAMADLLIYLAGGSPPGAQESVRAVPLHSGSPPVWTVGGYTAARQSACLGLPFVLAHFTNRPDGGDVLEVYRHAFQPSSRLDQPMAAAAVSVICAETDPAARRIASSFQLLRVRIEDGSATCIPSVEDASRHTFTKAQQAGLRQARNPLVVGSPERVHEELNTLSETLGVEELLVTTICHDFADRVRSYEMIARAI